ncbi:MAG: glycyl-radical enzyme activating protein [Anaerostipes faecalis]|nr:glycyl-radical enzyme activating protein [Anaerostipes faecalis]
MEQSALVFNIQNYSLHDGSGIRTIVFLKGCPLRCRWCCNPESQDVRAEISYVEQKCIGKTECTFCQNICGENAIKFEASGKAFIERSKCSRCLACAGVCPSKAIKVEGKAKSISSILNQVERESAFYRHGSGGLTISGGEPLIHRDWLLSLLKKAKRRRIHTAIETCGYADYGVMKEAAKYLDVILFDIKSINEEKHIEYTGKSNQKILKNFQRLCEDFPDLQKWVRTPVIPGFNDTLKELNEIQIFLKGKTNVTYEMLPYHRFGEGKYKMLGLNYEMGSQILSDEMKNYIENQKKIGGKNNVKFE